MRRKITAIIALTSTACTTWQTQYKPPKSVIEQTDMGPVELRMTGGRHVVVYAPKVVGDSVIGFDHKPLEGEDLNQSPRRVAVAAADIINVSTKKIAVGRSILAVTGIVLGLAIITAGSQGGSSSNTNNSCATAPTTQVQPNS